MAEVYVLDFQGALGFVNQRLVAQSVEAFRVEAKMDSWIAQHMKDRAFGVTVKRCLFDAYLLYSGMSEGATLEPLPFVM